MALRRRTAISFGERTWSGRSGKLVLAPSYPFGGTDGDHLLFIWREGADGYAISVHAWQPLDETVADLQMMVESIPSLD